MKFKKGDIIKPTKDSPYQSEHWRYVVVLQRPEGICAIDFHNNINLLKTEEIPYLEVVTGDDDEGMREDYRDEVIKG